MRILLALLLTLTLAATSVSAAVMRSEMQGATEMTICSDIGETGVTTIRLDATGKPIPAHHSCPDCTAAHATALILPPAALLAPDTAARRLLPATLATGTGRPSPAAIARGPPSLV